MDRKILLWKFQAGIEMPFERDTSSFSPARYTIGVSIPTIIQGEWTP